MLTHCLQHRSLDVGFIINLILQMRNLRHKEIKEFNQCQLLSGEARNLTQKVWF